MARPRKTRLVDITGLKFGRLTVVSRAGSSGSHATWFCVCECGNTREISGNSLRRSGDKLGRRPTRSCGCLASDETRERNVRSGHGLHGTKEYRAWVGMITRCYNSNRNGFQHYGGRGIKVCDEWRDSPEEFIKHVGPAPSPSHSLDRIDNDGDYRPGNVRWATWNEQARNRRPARRIVA